MNDVVYILKKGIKSEELKYSLRSVEENFPHGKVWFFGDCPRDIKPDVFVRFEQIGRTKWEKSTSTLRAIARSGVSDDFWLFNDDFFILEPISDLPYMFKGELLDRVSELSEKYGKLSDYARNLEKTSQILAENGLKTLDYALHIPMLINKEKALKTLDFFPNCPMFRSLYGNFNDVGGQKTEDVKIYDINGVPLPGQKLLSTCDDSFSYGNVGRFIKEKFVNPSRWEVRR